MVRIAEKSYTIALKVSLSNPSSCYLCDKSLAYGMDAKMPKEKKEKKRKNREEVVEEAVEDAVSSNQNDDDEDAVAKKDRKEAKRQRKLEKKNAERVTDVVEEEVEEAVEIILKKDKKSKKEKKEKSSRESDILADVEAVSSKVPSSSAGKKSSSNNYCEHPSTAAMTSTEIAAYREEVGLQVIPDEDALQYNPMTSFEFLNDSLKSFCPGQCSL